MKQIVKLLSLISAGALLVSVLLSCGILNSEDDDGPKLEDLPGKIVYSAEKGSNSHIFITDQEGTQQLTSAEDAEGHFHATDPSFSLDGQWIIYSANKGSGFGAPAIYMIRADGSERDSLTNENGELIHGENPVFSPDGNRVAFNRAEVYEPAYQNNDIYVVELSNGKVRKLTENTAHDTHPTWSPDENRIAFISHRDNLEEFETDLYVMDSNGSDITRLTQTGNTGQPLWHPNGQSLIYWSDNSLYKLNLDNNTSIPISLKLDEKTGFRPLDISEDGKYILLHIFSYSNPREEQMIQVVELSNHSLRNLISKTSFNGADWYISDND